jgi:CubicO group peptidase (beta-lactamase class C family)
MSKLPAWMEPALAYIPQWLGYQMRLTEQPGCSIAIAYRGRIVLEAAFGHADIVAGEKLTSRHRFRVASHSKAFTAAAIMKLREMGLVRLDDNAGQYVKGLHPDIAAATLGQLLSHSAGIFRDGVDSAYWSDRAPFSDQARISKDFRLPPTIDANTRLKYSNHGFALAGLVIEAITGEAYSTWIEREILRPAGLAETTPDVPLPAKVKLARGHSDRALLARRLVFAGDQRTHALAPATGFVSTASDLARFFGQLAPNARASVLTPASRREMSRPQWRDVYSSVERSYGLGTMSGVLDGWEWFGHSGRFLGYITRTNVVPTRELAISVLTNASDGMADAWLEGALQILKRFQSEGAPGTATADWSGRWWSVWGATDLVSMGDKVLLAAPGMTNPFLKVTELAVAGADEAHIVQAGAFDHFGEPVRRVRNKAGKLTELHIAGGKLIPEAALVKELVARYGD